MAVARLLGFGTLLGAELLTGTNEDLTSFDTADRLAGIAGLVPLPRDSGRITGKPEMKRPRPYDLLRVFVDCEQQHQTSPQSRNYYDRWLSAQTALTSSATPRTPPPGLNVLWAMQRDNISY